MPAGSEKFQQVNVSLSGPIVAFLERLAAENGITRAAQIRMFLLDAQRRMNGEKPPPRLEKARPPR
jgi:hypothetical protein